MAGQFKYTPEHNAFIYKMKATSGQWADVAKRFNERFNQDKSPGALQAHFSRHINGPLEKGDLAAWAAMNSAMQALDSAFGDIRGPLNKNGRVEKTLFPPAAAPPTAPPTIPPPAPLTAPTAAPAVAPVPAAASAPAAAPKRKREADDDEPAAKKSKIVVLKVPQHRLRQMAIEDAEIASRAPYKPSGRPQEPPAKQNRRKKPLKGSVSPLKNDWDLPEWLPATVEQYGWYMSSPKVSKYLKDFASRATQRILQHHRHTGQYRVRKLPEDQDRAEYISLFDMPFTTTLKMKIQDVGLECATGPMEEF